MTYLDRYLGRRPEIDPLPSDPRGPRRVGAPIDTSGRPDDTFALITREEFYDYERRFRPIEDLANASVLDPARRRALRDEALGFASDAARRGAEASTARLAVARSRFNAPHDERSARSEKRRIRLAEARSEVGGRNAARRFVEDRELALLGG